MTLHINTASPDEIILALREGARLVAQKKIKAPRQQAEKLVPGISRLLESKKIKPAAIKKIVVVNRGGSFTSLRIGVITANALAYAWQIPVEAEGAAGKAGKKSGRVSIVEPIYDRAPNIGISEKPRL